MMYLDTHVAVWLYAGVMERFAPACLDLLESETLLISPMVLLELQYLHELERVKVPATTIAEGLRESVGMQVCSLPFHRVMMEALVQSWTRDPFDRIIVGQASARSAPLMTKDRTILAHYSKGVWECRT